MANQPIYHHEQRDYTVGTRQKASVLQKTYALLGVSFLPAAGGALLAMQTGWSIFHLVPNRWLSLIAFFGIFYGLNFIIEKNRYNMLGAALLMVLTGFLGFTLGPILNFAIAQQNGAHLVGIAALMTAAVFLVMSAMAKASFINTSKLGNFLMIGVVIAVVAMVANFFLQLPALLLTVSALFVLISSLMITWQVRTVIDGGEDSYISAALTLFVSIYNLFTSLLNILLAFSGND